MNKFLESKLSEWLWRAVMTALLAAFVFVRDAATKADIAPINSQLVEINRAIVKLETRFAVLDALREARKTQDRGDQ